MKKRKLDDLHYVLIMVSVIIAAMHIALTIDLIRERHLHRPDFQAIIKQSKHHARARSV